MQIINETLKTSDELEQSITDSLVPYYKKLQETFREVGLKFGEGLFDDKEKLTDCWTFQSVRRKLLNSKFLQEARQSLYKEGGYIPTSVFKETFKKAVKYFLKTCIIYCSLYKTLTRIFGACERDTYVFFDDSRGEGFHMTLFFQSIQGTTKTWPFSIEIRQREFDNENWDTICFQGKTSRTERDDWRCIRISCSNLSQDFSENLQREIERILKDNEKYKLK